MGRSKRVLIFNVNWVGDVLFSTAAIRNIRRNFPDSFIACIIPSRCYPVLKGNPHLDEVIIFDEKDRHKGILSKLGFVKMLKEKKFDLVFLLHRSFSRALICRLANIPERFGYHTRKRAFLMSKKIMPPPKDSLHRIDYYLKVLEGAGFAVTDRHTEFFTGEEDLKAVDEFLRKAGVLKGDLLVAVNPGGNWLPKRWPQEYWARLADRLIRELGAKIIITGGASDAALARKIKGLMHGEPIIATGAFSLKQLAALSKRADLFISADTGPLHIANAAGAKRIIAIFGPTHPRITGPYPTDNISVLQKDIGCKIPCYVVRCQDNRCMKAISADEVFKEAQKFISAKKL